MPSSSRRRFTSGTVVSPKWKIEAASAAWAVAARRGRRRARAARSSALPPPPDAITGIGDARRPPRAAARGRSRSRVPSRSMLVSRISPAPASAMRAAHSTASMPGRPAAAVRAHLPAHAARCARRRASRVDRDHRLALPIITAASPTRSGFSTAAVMIETLSAPALSRSRTSCERAHAAAHA